MARVRIILEDDNGHPLTVGAEQLYCLQGPCNTLAQRQQDNGMRWSQRGSHALGIIAAYRANGHWDQLWDTSTLSA